MTKQSLLLCKPFATALFLILCVASMADRAAAQATLTLTGGTGAPGGAGTVGVSLNTNGTLPARLQFNVSYASTDLTPPSRTSSTPTPAPPPPAKSPSCI